MSSLYVFLSFVQGGSVFGKVLASFCFVHCRVCKVNVYTFSQCSELCNDFFTFFSEYGNIGYHSTRNQSVPLDSTTQLDDVESNAHSKSKDKLNKKCDQMKPVVPIISIDLPD